MNCLKMLHATLLCVLIIFGATLSSAQAQPRGQAQQSAVYLPLLLGGAATTTPPPPAGSLPSSLVGSWFSGQLLPRELYDPTTGQWGSANGLGQQYEFTVGGAFSYLAFFHVEVPGCSSEVSVYRQGSTSVAGQELRLRPMTVKTRTVTYCGSRKETVTDGPYDERNVPWSIGYDQFGVTQLTLTEDGKATTYRKNGMAEQLVGAWHNGDLTSAGFYNPATGAFTADPAEGWWVSITADGRYRWGEFAHAIDNQGCALAGWLYLEGTVSIAGSHITFTPSAGVARVENACTPELPRQEPWQEDAKGFTWLLRDYQTQPRLVLIPDGRFQEYEFLPE
ncbi:MAG TPA: hypothetical protein VFU22_26590 [Roseiflexaceae bacterium]|nr:hypothetical protein [Roseiflexaceae bacterium]